MDYQKKVLKAQLHVLEISNMNLCDKKHFLFPADIFQLSFPLRT